MEQLCMVNNPSDECAWKLQLNSYDPIRQGQFDYACRTAMTRYGINILISRFGNYVIAEFDEIDYIKIWKASTDIGNGMGLIILFV